MATLRFLSTTFLFSVLAATAGAVPFEELLYRGQALPFYGTAATPRQEQVLASLKRANYSERMASLVQSSVRLRSNLNVGFESCGRPNAYFEPHRARIVLCLEMLELIVQRAQQEPETFGKLDKNSLGKVMDGVVWGIFLHELGHAIIAVNRVAITGREEDVADQFALYYAINFVEPRGVLVISPTIWFFKTLATSRSIAGSNQDDLKLLLADEHSLNDQRTYNLACWLLGAGSNQGKAIARLVGLPEQRADRCSAEYIRLEAGIKARFKKYFLPRTP